VTLPVLPRKRLKRPAAPEVKTIGLTSAWPGWGSTYWPNLAGRDHFKDVAIPNNSVVAVGLAWIRRNIHKGRIVAGREIDNGTYEETPGHDLIRMLRRPNRVDSWKATLGGTADCLVVDGYAYWIKERNRLREVTGVYWVPNHTITPVEELDPALQQANGPIKGYWYRIGAYEQWYEPSEVVHFRSGRDPLCRWQGLSDLKKQIRAISGIDAADRYTAAVLLNAHAGKVLTPRERADAVYESSPDEQAMRALGRQIEEGASGENAGRVIKTSLAVELLDLGMGPEQMALDTIRDWPAAVILSAMGLNPLTLNLPGGAAYSTFTNKGQADREAFNNAVLPMQDLMSDEVEHQLLPEFNDDADQVWWDRKDVEELREDANDRVARARQLRPDGALATLNEVREIVDLAPVEGGDRTPVEEEQEAIERAESIQAAMGGAEDDFDEDFGEDSDVDPDDETKSLDGLGEYLKARGGGGRRRPKGASGGTPRSGKPPRDGDKDGRIYDGTSRERTAPRTPAKPEEAANSLRDRVTEMKRPDSEVEVVVSPPKNAAERRFLEKVEERGGTAVVVERSPMVREVRTEAGVEYYVGDRRATRVYQADRDMPDVGVSKGDWINQHEGSWAIPHRTRTAAERDARLDATRGARDESSTDRLAFRGRVRDYHVEDYLPEPGHRTVFRVLSKGE